MDGVLKQKQTQQICTKFIKNPQKSEGGLHVSDSSVGHFTSYRVGLLKYARSSLCSKKVGNRKNRPHVMKSNFWFCIRLHGSFFKILMYLLKQILFWIPQKKILEGHTGQILWKFENSRLHSLLVLDLNCVKLALFFWKCEFPKNTY